MSVKSFAWSESRSYLDVRPMSKFGTFQSFYNQRLAEDCYRDVKEGPGFIAALFDPAYRKDSNVTRVDALLFDLDGTPRYYGFDELMQLVRGWQMAAYTTYSSRPGQWRWRLVVPLATPTQADSYAAARQAFLDVTGLKEGDPTAASPSHFFYYPGCDPDYWNEKISVHKAGKRFDPNALPSSHSFKHSSPHSSDQSISFRHHSSHQSVHPAGRKTGAR
jgi:hypothetical protein